MIVPDITPNDNILLLIFRTNTADELINTTTLEFGKDQDVKGFFRRWTKC